MAQSIVQAHVATQSGLIRYITWHVAVSLAPCNFIVGYSYFYCINCNLPLQVNNNGAISFLEGVSQHTPDPFPLFGARPLIAPYWADVDTRGTGTVWYRETTDPLLLARAMDEIQTAFISQGSFSPTFLFIATWDRVGYFDSNTDRVRCYESRWQGFVWGQEFLVMQTYVKSHSNNMDMPLWAL